MKQYFIAIIGITRAYQLRFYRDKVALFFTLLFPLIFLFIFGSIFNNTSTSFRIALINQSDSSFARDFAKNASKDEVFELNDSIKTLEDAKQKMGRGEVDSVIVLPDNFGQIGKNKLPAGDLEVYYEPGSEQAGQTVAAIMEQIMTEINQSFGQPEPSLGVVQKSTGDKGLSQFDYTLSGLLGFTILGSSIFGLANVMPSEKQKGSFRRLRASPFKAAQLIIGNALHYLIVTILSLVVMIAVSLLVFDFEMRGSWLQFGLFASLASVMMIGFGLLIGGWAKNENQAAPVSNLVSFPLMFLSGIFFPRFLFPEWLQGITDFIPLAPVVDGFRRIMTEGANLTQLGPEILLISVWLIGLYILAIKLFRWE